MITADGDSNHTAVVDHFFVDESLKLKLRSSLGTHFDGSCTDDQSATGKYGPAEPDVIHAPKAQKVPRSQNVELASIEACELGGTFAEDDPRHQWEAGHMAADPELIIGHVLEPHNPVILAIDMDHAAELFHFMPLRIYLLHVFAVVQRLVVVELRDVVESLWRHVEKFY